MKKLIALFLALVMMSGCLVLIVGCNGNGTTTPTDIDTDAVDTVVIEEQLEVPDVTYDGADFIVYMGGQGVGDGDKFNDWDDENSDYTSVATAIFKRNKQLESLYDVKISNDEHWGTENGSGPSYLKVAEEYASGECTYSLYEVGTMAAANLARNGYLYDLNSMPYIALEKSWWDQGAKRDLEIQGKMYYATGDISVIDNLNTHNVYFNKELAKELGINDLYSLVESGAWTLDKYVEYVKLASKDLNGDDKRDENDRYGAIIWNDAMQAIFAGCEQRICTINNDGEIELTYYDEKTVDLVSKFTDVAFNREISYNYVIRLDTWQQWDPTRIGMFANDQALFFLTVLNTFIRLRNQDVDFGILPYPKYNEDQSNYLSYVSGSSSNMVCVGALMGEEDRERNGALIEAAAYYSKKIVTPEYYDYTLKGKLIRDDESSPCLDLIIGNRIFDVGMYYLIGKYTWDMTEMMKAETNNIASKYQEDFNVAMQEIEKLNSDFLKAGYN